MKIWTIYLLKINNGNYVYSNEIYVSFQLQVLSRKQGSLCMCIAFPVRQSHFRLRSVTAFNRVDKIIALLLTYMFVYVCVPCYYLTKDRCKLQMPHRVILMEIYSKPDICWHGWQIKWKHTTHSILSPVFIHIIYTCTLTYFAYVIKISLYFAWE